MQKQIHHTGEPFVINVGLLTRRKKYHRMKRRAINIVSNWQNQKAILKERFKRLNDTDLDFEESRKNEMLSKLALKLGMTTREILRIIERGL
jgi:hypothetical protein